MSPNRRNSQDTSSSANSSNNNSSSNDPSFDAENGPWPCSYPQGCLFSNGSNLEHIQISSEDLYDSVKVKCSNEHCRQSTYMHSVCFEAFEEVALQHLKASSRAKSWSERQRVQNVWTKRGYDLVYKACDCLCGHGHLRKDMDWTPPPAPAGFIAEGGECVEPPEGVNGTRRKRKKSKTQNTKPSLTFGLPMSTHHQNNAVHRSDAQNVPLRHRTNSVCSNASGGSGSLTSSGSCSYSPSDNNNSNFNAGNVNQENNNMMLLIGSPGSSGGVDGTTRRASAFLNDRTRHDSGGSIFLRRMDYSSFNSLPKHKINSYHIKMEDECSIGNDETRIFILSSFASNKMNKVPCVVCSHPMQIYDRYPLVDGTFFLSPRQHNKTSIQVKYEGKYHYLTSVCMGCLEGWTKVHCRYCLKPWTGSHLILGTMYSYDIFAAMPCCPEKLKCNNCSHLVIHPDQRFNFFSDYSQMVSCPNCGVQEYHFCKSLSGFVGREEAKKIAQQQQAGGMRVHRVNSA